MNNLAATILIVDDEPHNRKLLEALLRPEGYLTRTAANGEEALASIAQSAPDLILLDVMMPNMNGYQVASVLKADPVTSNIPIIMVTAQTDRSARLASLNAGAEEFLTKPVDRAELWIRVRNLLRLKTLGDLLQNHSSLLEQTVQARTVDLTASELRFRQMADNIGDVFFLRDADGDRMLYISPAYEEIWGRRCDSLYADPQSWFETIHPDDQASAYERFTKGALSADSKFDFRIVRPDGSIRWIESKTSPVHDDTGRIVRIAGVASDITLRKQASQELQASQRRFSDLLGSVELISVMLDREARITYCNDYLLRLTGWEREEVIGRHWFEHFMPSELGDMKPVFLALLANRPEALHRENEILTRSGERRLIRWHNSVLRSGADEVVGTASIGEDITEQKQAEIRITRLNRVYAVLSGINTLIVRVHDRDELFREACKIAVEHGNFGMVWIGMLDPATLDVTPVAWAGESVNEVLSGKTSARDDTPHGKGSVGQAIRERRPIFNNDIIARDTGGPHRKEILGLGFRSQITLPLFENQTVVGILKMYAREADFFDAQELRLLSELAGDISFALQHIGKEQKIARLSRIQAVMGNINSMIVRVRDRQELFDETCRIAVEHGGFDLACIGHSAPATLEMTSVAWHGADAEVFAKLPWTGKNLVAQALKEKRAMFRNDLPQDVAGGGPRRQEAVRRGYRSFVVLPLLVAGTAVANISLFTKEPNFVNEGELSLLNQLAGDISFALDHIEKQERLDYLAYYDVLTGLANRGLFLERLAQCLRSAVSGGHKLAVYLIDLERFKNINDTLGRPAGDALLNQVAQWLKRDGGDENLLARVAGDQFAVMLPEVKHDEDVARLLEKAMAEFLDYPFLLADSIFRVAAKIGVAICPDDGADPDTLFKNAEAALKKAKSSGERYLFYTQKMTAAVAEKLTLENQLRDALDKEEFVLHYQPKITVESGQITGAEALIRWNDPRTGLVPPAQFIPVLEETGLIYEVGRWALRKAVADYLRWRAMGLVSVRIAVNVSPLQLRNRGFIADIKDVIGVNTQAAAGLELEITESMIMEDVKHSIVTLQAIRDMGVSIALDDFGTGFSSLSYLSRLPVNTLKIDRSFVIDMTTGPDGLALVSTIITLAHALRLKVVAEGVETEEQSRLLRLLDCDEIQGFLFSKPVPAASFVTVLRERRNRRLALGQEPLLTN